jgi:uncharacterized protein YkwD
MLTRQTSLQGLTSRRTVRRLGVATALAMAFLGSVAISAARASCPGASASPNPLSSARYTVYCLINEERTDNGLSPLALNTSLSRAAQHHSRAMNARNFFGHTGDGSPVTRVRRAGYMKGTSSWGVGEDLGWGPGAIATPDYAVRAWMASPIHRAELLSPRYYEVGVGVALGSPIPRKRAGAIYTADFGFRH